MRAREFITAIFEAENTPGYYTVGDSHSNGVGNYGRGKVWKAMGKDGSSAFNSMHMDAINKIPAGSVVAISLGANDLGSKPISQIVGRVQTVISAAQSKGLQVVYLLPTTTAPNKPNDPKREELRDALNSAVSVPIVDLGQASSADKQGLHLDMGRYASIGNQIVNQYKPKGGSGVEPKDKKDLKYSDFGDVDKGLQAGPPFPKSDRDAVMAMQKRLEELGYSVGSTGADGKYGPRTAAAVLAFKADNKLSGDANHMNGKDLEVLKTAKKLENPTPVGGTADGGKVEIPKATGNASNPDKALKFFISKGLTPAQAAGIVGNLQAESGRDLNTSAVGDNGKAFGIAQWRIDKAAGARAVKFKEKIGKNVLDASIEEQLAFIWWELNNTYASAGRKLKAAKTAEEAAWIIDKYYEQSSGAHREKRMQYASNLYKTTATA